MKNTGELYILRILNSLEGSMESYGFKRHSLTYYKKTDYYYFLVDWQLSKDKIPGAIKFTVNIGIYDLNLAKILQEDIVSYPDVWSCHLRQRVGRLLENPSDKWWLFPLDSPVTSATIREFEELLTKIIVPYLSVFNSAESLLNLWKTGASPGLTRMQRLDFISLLISDTMPWKDELARS